MKCLFTYQQNFESEQLAFERNEDIPLTLDLKTRFQKYNKSYFRFDSTLEQQSRRRNFLQNAFNFLNLVLENKFMRNSRQKNFCRISFTKNIDHFLNTSCIFIRQFTLRQFLYSSNLSTKNYCRSIRAVFLLF